MAIRDNINVGDKVIYYRSDQLSLKCIIIIKEGAGCWCQLASAAEKGFSVWLRNEPTLNNYFYVPYHTMQKIASFKQLKRRNQC